MNLIEKYLGEAKNKFEKGQKVSNLKTGVKFTVIQDTGKDQVQVQGKSGKKIFLDREDIQLVE